MRKWQGQHPFGQDFPLSVFDIFAAGDATNLTCIFVKTSGKISKPITQAGNNISVGQSVNHRYTELVHVAILHCILHKICSSKNCETCCFF